MHETFFLWCFWCTLYYCSLFHQNNFFMLSNCIFLMFYIYFFRLNLVTISKREDRERFEPPLSILVLVGHWFLFSTFYFLLFLGQGRGLWGCQGITCVSPLHIGGETNLTSMYKPPNPYTLGKSMKRNSMESGLKGLDKNRTEDLASWGEHLNHQTNPSNLIWLHLIRDDDDHKVICII